MYGDYVLYSLHKMLPFKSGGMLKVNCSVDIRILGNKNTDENPFAYDLYGIAIRRKANAKLWNGLLKDHGNSIDVLRPYNDEETPQTFPIIIKKYDRNLLYFKLNDAGYGAVSLYHTMIDQIKNGDNENAVWLSNHIINMPVHQDTEADEIEKMAKLLISIVEEDL
jgi:dTDP-4-amino-4,6-dideoxygalactose transaminase